MIYAAVTIAATMLFALNEFCTLNRGNTGYSEHIRKKPVKYVLLAILFMAQAVLFSPLRSYPSDEYFIVLNLSHFITLHGSVIAVLCFINLVIAVLSSISLIKNESNASSFWKAKFKLRIFTVFIILFVILCILSGKHNVLTNYVEDDALSEQWFAWPLPYIILGSVLYLAPLLIHLSNHIYEWLDTETSSSGKKSI